MIHPTTHPTRRAMLAGSASFVAAMSTGRCALAQSTAATSGVASSTPGTASQVGRFTVTGLSDGVLVPMPPVQPSVPPGELRDLFQKGGADPATFEVPVNAFLVRSEDRTVLIDAGGELPGFPTLGRLGANLRAMGVAPEDIDVLLLTHLHVDHIGGMIAADGTPMFANADVILTEAEHAFWHDDAILASVPVEQQGMFRLARDAVAAYGPRVERIAGEAEVLPGITSVPLPGHTPGHAGFLIADGEESLLVWGDVVQVQPIQFARPDLWVYEVDPDVAIATRRAMMDPAALDRLTVAGMHHMLPGFGRIDRDGEGFSFRPLEQG